jgi:hypothetical protein
MKDRNNLDRHLKLAAQWLKKRQSGWDSGIDTRQAYKLEQRLFPSLSLLSDYASDYLIDQWPEKPWPLKVALIAALQSESMVVFEAALEKLATLLLEDDASFYVSVLWLANPVDLSKEKRVSFCNSRVPATMTEADFHHCYWSDETMQYLAIQCDWSLPAWLPESASLNYSNETILLRSLILNKPESASALTRFLASEPSDSTKWQWITLTRDPLATDLYFQHCEQEPQHLAAAALQGSNTYVEKLLQCFSKSALAEIASDAVETILATPIEWQPVLKSAENGQPLKDSPSLPVAPNNTPSSDYLLLQGQPKTAINVAHWALSQPATMQALAWYHLGQSCAVVLPNLSKHWTHSQWHLLKQRLPNNRQVSHAA